MADTTPKTLAELYPGISTGEEEAKAPAAPPVTAAPSAVDEYGIGDASTMASNEAPPDISELSGMYPGIVQGPSTKEAVKEAAIGTAQGAARDAPVMAGGMAGFRIGLPLAAKAAPVMGPWAALIPVTTTAAGLGAGYLFGQEADKWFPAVSREDLIPYREGGKTFGSSISTAPAAFSLPVMTGNRVARFISAFGETARLSPKTYMLAETGTAGMMGIAGGVSEAVAPGKEGVRFGSELVAGMVSPFKLLTTAVDLTKSGLAKGKNFIAGRGNKLENKAANLLLSALEKHGEDPEQLIKVLRQQIPESVPTPTAAQKTGSQALMDMEASLGAHHAEFGGETVAQGKTALKAYQQLIQSLQDIGDPQSLRMAATLRETKFLNMLDSRLSLADANAAKKIANISKDTPEARAAIGDIVKTETELALRNARDVESELWTEAIDRMTAPVKGTSQYKVSMEGSKAQAIYDRTGIWPQQTITQATLKAPVIKPSATAEVFLKRASTVGEALYDDAIPAPVRKIMESLRVDKDAVAQYKAGKLTEDYLSTKQVPSGFIPNVSEIGVDDLVNYRSTLLKMSRESAGKGDVNNAEFYGALAEGMLRDLDTLQSPLLDQARQFSKALNDTFTRTFAKTASITGDVTRAGAERLPAEILVQRAFGANADVTAHRMEQIEDAVKFMRTQYDEAVTTFGKGSPEASYLKPLAELSDTGVASIQDAQNRVLRLLASTAVDTVYDQAKGTYIQKLNTAKLTKFAQQNAPMLEKLGIMGDLRDAAHAQNLLTQVANENSILNKVVSRQTAFSQVLAGGENPTRAVMDALSSRHPVRSIGHMAKLAKAGGRDALDGLKSTLYDYAYTKAGGNSSGASRFSVQAFDDALFKPISPKQPSIVNIMRANGLMSLTEIKNLRRLINPMVRVETALKNNIPYDDIIQGADAVTEMALRIAGAELGKTGAKTVGGSANSLIAASAGSKAVRQLFDNLPNTTVRHILENAVKDPEAMAILLARGRTEKESLGVFNRVLDYMGKLGVGVGKNAATPALNYLAPEEPRPSQLRGGVQPPFTPQGQAARQLRQLPKAPGTRGVPGLGNQAPAAPAAPEQGAAASSESRNMFQQLFPFDSIGAMAAQPEQPPPQ